MRPTDGCVPLNAAPAAAYSSTEAHTRYTRDWWRSVLASENENSSVKKVAKTKNVYMIVARYACS